MFVLGREGFYTHTDAELEGVGARSKLNRVIRRVLRVLGTRLNITVIMDGIYDG